VFSRSQNAGNVLSTTESQGFRETKGFGPESTETGAGSFGNWHRSLKDAEGQPRILLKVADPGRRVSAGRLEPEGPGRNPLTTGSHNSVDRQDTEGNFSQPAGAPRKGDAAGKARGRAGQAAAIVEKWRRRTAGQQARADPGPQGRRVGTAGMARRPNPAARRGAGRAGETLVARSRP
jgi:hypothetical protein